MHTIMHARKIIIFFLSTHCTFISSYFFFACYCLFVYTVLIVSFTVCIVTLQSAVGIIVTLSCYFPYYEIN